VCYAKDAMTGLRLMNELMDPATRERVLSEHAISGNGVSVTTTVKIAEKPHVTRSPKCAPICRFRSGLSGPEGAAGAGFARGVELHQSVHAVWKAHGYRGILRSIWRRGKRRRWSCLTGWKSEERGRDFYEGARGVAIFEAEAEGEALHLFSPGGAEPVHTWKFRRQKIGISCA